MKVKACSGKMLNFNSSNSLVQIYVVIGHVQYQIESNFKIYCLQVLKMSDYKNRVHLPCQAIQLK